MRRFIIDTDTAADDAAAIIYMLRQPDIRVEAITTVSGNVNAASALSNALSSVEAADTYFPPVYAGCTRPMIREPFFAMYVHGKDGLGDSGITPQKLKPSHGHAVDKLCEIIMNNPGEIELLTLGPLTNVALAYLKYPEIAKMVKNVVVMGGCGFSRGNVSEFAEFNIYADAEAAKVVIASGMNVTLVGSELSTDECALDANDADILKNSPDTAANFINTVCRRLREYDRSAYGRDEIFIPDAVAAAVAIDNSVSSRLEPVFADVEVKDEVRYGQVVMTQNPEKPNALLAHKLDSKKFKKMFFDSVSKAVQ